MQYNHLSKTIAAMCLVVLFSTTGFSQCNNFVKKKCMPNILPFMHNGQTNTATLAAGQSSEMKLTFYSGQGYRILVCAQSVLGTVAFKIMDLSHKVVFDSKENDNPDFWDFKVKSTQQFIVQVAVPPSDSYGSVPPSGCVSVLVGFKKD